jgi:endonuclease YncB( thermonuclease family)
VPRCGAMLPAVPLCLVVGISDGDTLKARCDDHTLSVRLADVDAPEKGQAFGNRSRQALAALCFRRPAELRPVSIDRYGRTVAHVDCGGDCAGQRRIGSGLRSLCARWLRSLPC